MIYSKRTKKRFGQHWLIDNKILENIVEIASIVPTDRLIEIGPGKGNLTSFLLDRSPSFLQAYEIDCDLIPYLTNKFQKYRNFSLFNEDFLSVDLNKDNIQKTNKVVANIPYNITGPILKKIVGKLADHSTHKFDCIVLLIQKEIADRIIAKPSSSNYSALSVRMQLISNCKEICLVPPEAFSPRPKVYSKVIAVYPYNYSNRQSIEVEACIEKLLNIAFMSRRKKIRNSLCNIVPINFLNSASKDLDISLDMRPQNISPSNWIKLSNYLITRNLFTNEK